VSDQTVDIVDGDTWESIAASRSIAVADLLVVNGLDPSSTPIPLSPGWSVLVPGDAPEVCVAPDHAHSLNLGGTERLWIRCDMAPDEAEADPGSIRVYDSASTYDVTQTIADHYISNGATVDLVFDGCDHSAAYSIDYIAGDGATTSIVQAKTFAELQDHDHSNGPVSASTAPTPASSDASDLPDS
jgi:hypothetical protein